MYISLAQTTAPSVEPILKADAKVHIRLPSAYVDDDTYIESLISAARHYVETATNRQLITATWKQRMDSFPAEIVLRKGNVQSITSIAYDDENGDAQTLSSSLYQVDLNYEPSRIKPAYGEVWPSTRPGEYASVTVTFTAGYGASGTYVPAGLKHAILLLVGQWYEHREPVVTGIIAAKVPYTVENLIAPYKMRYMHGC